MFRVKRKELKRTEGFRRRHRDAVLLLKAGTSLVGQGVHALPRDLVDDAVVLAHQLMLFEVRPAQGNATRYLNLEPCERISHQIKDLL